MALAEGEAENETMSTHPRSAVFQAAGSAEDLTLTALQKAVNLLREHPATVIEIVVSGAAVRGLVAGHVTSMTVEMMLEENLSVTVVACRNALRAYEIDEATLADPIGAVPAAVARIAERQWDDWALIVI